MLRERSPAVFQRMHKVKKKSGKSPYEAASLAIVAWEHRLEEAVLFLAEHLAQAIKKTKKPVMLHSLRVGSALMARGLPEDVVIAGMLHDIMEKTAVSTRDISRRFGREVGLIVQATTNDPRIQDPLERYTDSLQRCAQLGEGALMVRVADLLDNCDRLTALNQYDRLERLAEKIRLLHHFAKTYGLDPAVALDLSRRLRRIRTLTGGATKRRSLVEHKKIAKDSTMARRGKKSNLRKKSHPGG